MHRRRATGSIHIPRVANEVVAQFKDSDSLVRCTLADDGLRRIGHTSGLIANSAGFDLLGNRVEAESGTAEFVACCSALCRLSVAAGLLVLGDMTVQGNVKSLGSLAEPLCVAIDNGAKRASIPICNKSNLLDVSAEILEHGNAIFKGAPQGRGAEGAGQGVGNTNRLASLQPGHPSSAFDSTMR
jgi:hypothetical protein